MNILRVGIAYISDKLIGIGKSRGDLLVYNGTSWQPLSPGTDSDVLQVDPAEPLGIKWGNVTENITGSLIVSAYTSSDASGGEWTTIPFDTETVDTYEAFDTGTYTFTAPADGVYIFVIYGTLSSSSYSAPKFGISVNGGNVNYWSSGGYSSGGSPPCSFNITLPLSSNDTVTGKFGGLNILGVMADTTIEVYKL